MRLRRRTMMAGLAVAPWCGGAQAEDVASPVPGKRVALRGYDPVAYFTDGRPVPGDPRFWYEFDDTVYMFASAAHRTLFVANADHFAPQFRGFCTLSISEGGNAEGMPENWKIVNGTLFVFGNSYGSDEFAKDPARYTALAKTNWATLQPK